jgi:DNA-binding transcriptional ArsR family regulator
MQSGCSVTWPLDLNGYPVPPGADGQPDPADSGSLATQQEGAQVADRLIRENGLGDRRHGGAGDPSEDGDPGNEQQQTVVDRRYLELRGRLLDVDGLRSIAGPVPIIEGLLYRDSLAWLAGKPGHAKSFVAVDLACCVGTGADWHGRRVTRGKVLYLIAEGAAGLGQRVNAWTLRSGRLVDQVLFLPVPVQMLHSVDVAAFTRLLDDLAPDLAILDTQARVTVGAEENSARDMGLFVDALEQVRRASGACILTVHHDARAGENLRGSTAIEGAATTILRASKDGQLVTITNPKQKDAPEQDPFALVLTPLGGSAVLSNEGIGLDHLTRSSEDRILTVLDTCFGQSGATRTELRDASELPRSTYYWAVNELVRKGLVIEHKEGRSTVYTLAADNRQGQIPTSPMQSNEP